MSRANTVLLRQLALLVALGCGGGAIADEVKPLTVAARQHRFACVCEMCKRRPLDACQCGQADAMRLQLGLFVAKLGPDERAIDDAMVSKYSAAVLQPIAEPKTSAEVPWLGPLVLGGLGAAIAWRIARTIRRRRRA